MEYVQSNLQKILSTRRGAALAAAVAAALSLVLIVAYVNHYRSSSSSGGSPAVVMVAGAKIAAGTSGHIIADQGLYDISHIRHDQLAQGALVSPAALGDRVLKENVYPGQQLTADDFAAPSSQMASQLAGTQLAISLTLDDQHALDNNIQPGNEVNVYATLSLPTPTGDHLYTRLISQRVKVMAVDHQSASTGQQKATTFVLEARNAKEAANWAYVADQGKLWLALRPLASRNAQAPLRVDTYSVLFGAPAVAGSGGK